MTVRGKYDAVVVGARAAGAATAMLLARRGARVLVLDRARYGSDTLSTHALMRAGVVQLHRWGLLDRVRASGAAAVSRVVFRYPGETVRVDLKVADGVGELFAPRRTVLDTILVDAAREAGAEFVFGAIADEVEFEGGRAVGLCGRDDQGEEIDLRAGVVIGADGIRSLVAQAAGAEVTRRGGRSGAIAYGYFSGVPAEGYEWSYAPGVSSGVIPTNDGQVVVFAGGPEDVFRKRVFPRMEAGFLEILRESSPAVAGRVEDGRQEGRLRGFAGVRGYVRECRGPGWALVGDAGYFRDPITAHGISDAFRDAELLARELSGELPGGSYQQLRDDVIRDHFDVTERIAGYDWTMDEIRVHLRDMSRSMKPELDLIESLDRREAA